VTLGKHECSDWLTAWFQNGVLANETYSIKRREFLFRSLNRAQFLCNSKIYAGV